MKATRESVFADFRQRYKSGEFILGMTCSTMSPVMTEIIGYGGFDFVIIDTEMMSINPETIESMVRAAEATGTVPIIKLKANNRLLISDALNTGAPMCKIPHAVSAEYIKRGVDAAYFHPRGSRGLCSVSRANRYGQGKMSELQKWTNECAQIIPIIEDKEAIENIDEIMAVDGVEVYDIGPVDLAHSYDLQPDKGFSHPELQVALDKIVEAADKYGKHVMTVPVIGEDLTPELTKSYLIDRGVKMIFYRTDSINLRNASRDAMRLFEGL